jgi:hypothetical protein
MAENAGLAEDSRREKLQCGTPTETQLRHFGRQGKRALNALALPAHELNRTEKRFAIK